MTNYLGTYSQELLKKVETTHPEFDKAENEVKTEINRMITTGKGGKRTPSEIHRDLGNVMWEYVGMSRSEKGLKLAIQKIEELQKDFDQNMILNDDQNLNSNLQIAGRLADFLGLGALMARDALERAESCGGHFRVESQDNGEAKRDDENYAHTSAWEYKGKSAEPVMHKEKLIFENVHPSVRSYK